jgi:cytochrome c oxidase subunit 2
MKHSVWPAMVLLGGCGGGPWQSAVDSAGAPASGIERLWWLFFWLLLAIFVIVMAVLGASLARRHRGIEQEPLERTHQPSDATEHGLKVMVAGATGVTVLILLVLIVISVSAAKPISGSGTKGALTVEVVGNQWWWYIRYLNDDASKIVVTANEMHIPVGKPVTIRGTSNDVIHSFWVPNLQGKRDLIPSRVTTEWIQADRPGRFRGQCSEFCGMQHAHMALWVVAEPEAQFEQWMEAQRRPAVAPANAVIEHGQQVFLNSACVFCHHIAGTTAAGQVAPDLTHFGGRLTIAAGTLPNNRGNLGGWLSDPQTIKPGTHMATVPLAPEDVQPLIEYLESLK